MKLSHIKAVKSFCESLLSSPDWREVVSHAIDEEHNFEVDNVRFIRTNCSDTIQQDELKSDLYTLGCFRAWFIAGVIGIDTDVIKAMQEAEAFEAIGKLIVSMGKLPELQEAYARADGYGHHFNHYDGNEENITINGIDYLVFDNH